jgi:hypothetical protein
MRALQRRALGIKHSHGKVVGAEFTWSRREFDPISFLRRGGGEIGARHTRYSGRLRYRARSGKQLVDLLAHDLGVESFLEERLLPSRAVDQVQTSAVDHDSIGLED